METLFWLAFIFIGVPVFWVVVYMIVQGFKRGGGSD